MSPQTLELLDKARSVIERQRLLLEAAIKIKDDAAALLDQMRSIHQQPMARRFPASRSETQNQAIATDTARQKTPPQGTRPLPDEIRYPRQALNTEH